MDNKYFLTLSFDELFEVYYFSKNRLEYVKQNLKYLDDPILLDDQRNEFTLFTNLLHKLEACLNIK